MDLQICRLRVKNFCGIRDADILLPKHAVLIGDNNIGKTTLLEAIDLVLGPDRLNRMPPIDEHDFYQGKYTADSPAEKTATDGEATSAFEAEDGEVVASSDEPVEAPRIEVEAVLSDLSEEQKRQFGAYIEFWNKTTGAFYEAPDPAGLDEDTITEALRVTLSGAMTRKRTILRGKPGTRVASQKMALQTDFQKKKSRFVAFYTCALFGRDHEPLAWNVAVCWTSFCDWKKSGRKCGKTQ